MPPARFHNAINKHRLTSTETWTIAINHSDKGMTCPLSDKSPVKALTIIRARQDPTTSPRFPRFARREHPPW
jgi:hypothetical protein